MNMSPENIHVPGIDRCANCEHPILSPESQSMNFSPLPFRIDKVIAFLIVITKEWYKYNTITKFKNFLARLLRLPSV